MKLNKIHIALVAAVATVAALLFVHTKKQQIIDTFKQYTSKRCKKLKGTKTSMNRSLQSIDNVLKGPTHSMTPNNRKKLENDRKRLQSQLDKKVKQYEDNC